MGHRKSCLTIRYLIGISLTGVLLGLASFAPDALGTQFYPVPLRERMMNAPILVRGLIGNSSVREAPGPDGMLSIFTYTEIEVIEVLKGSVASKNIEVREMGGELPDGAALEVAGRASFSNGEQVLVVLAPPAPDGTYDLQGLQMGKYNIENDGNGQEIVVGAGTRLAGEDQSRTFRLEEVRAWIPKAEKGTLANSAGNSDPAGNAGSANGAASQGQKTDGGSAIGVVGSSPGNSKLKTVAITLLVLGLITLIFSRVRRSGTLKK